MQSDVTEEELERWEHALRAVDEIGLSEFVDREIQERELRLIAAVREARAQRDECVKAVGKWATEVGTLEHKLAEIRAVLDRTVTENVPMKLLKQRLHEVIGE